MDNIKNDSYYVAKILKDVEYLIMLSSKYDRQQIAENETILDSIFFRFVQIAENSAKLSQKFKLANKEISWSSINGLRNRIVHDYGHTDFKIILDTLEKDVPFLKTILERNV